MNNLKEIPKPKYTNLTFKTVKEFEKWLIEKTYKKIHLTDHGQDLQLLYMDDFGEILHSDFHSSLYNGLFVNLQLLKDFSPLVISNEGEWQTMYRLIVESVESVNEKAA